VAQYVGVVSIARGRPARERTGPSPIDENPDFNAKNHQYRQQENKMLHHLTPPDDLPAG
jgi:hypothetical protein